MNLRKIFLWIVQIRKVLHLVSKILFAWISMLNLDYFKSKIKTKKFLPEFESMGGQWEK